MKIFGFGPQQVIFLPAFCPKNICVTGRNTFPFALFTAKKKQNVLAELIVTLLNTNIARMKKDGPPRRSTYNTVNTVQKIARSYNSQNQNCNQNQDRDRNRNINRKRNRNKHVSRCVILNSTHHSRFRPVSLNFMLKREFHMSTQEILMLQIPSGCGWIWIWIAEIVQFGCDDDEFETGTRLQ